MSTWLAAGVALAAIAASYFFCVRPGMRGQCAARRRGSAADTADAELDRQLAQLREEVRVLHAQDLLDTARPPRSPAPPHES